MDNLLSEPHQADEGAESAGNHKTALEAVCKQVLSARERITPLRSSTMQLVTPGWAGGLTVTGPVLLKTFKALVCLCSLSRCTFKVGQTNKTA